MSASEVIELRNISPKALTIIDELAKTLGLSTRERVIEELSFAIHEINQIIDDTKDPLLEPEANRRQMEVMRGITQRFKRFK